MLFRKKGIGLSSAGLRFTQSRKYSRPKNKNVEEVIQREGVGLSLLLNMNVSEYVRMLYDSWEGMGKRFSEVSEESLERADLLLQGYNPWWGAIDFNAFLRGNILIGIINFQC